MSRFHAEHPFSIKFGDQEYGVGYLPGDSDSGMFGGNSNWRGPVWMPMNILLIRALLNLYKYFGDDLKVEFPTGSGKMMTLFEVAGQIGQRICGIFLQDSKGQRPVYGTEQKFQKDPYWKDHILFYEYFHGDTGAGIGASHQTGWTGLAGLLLKIVATIKPSELLQEGKSAFFKNLAKSS